MKKFENILVAFDLNKTLFYKCQSPLPRIHDRKMKRLYFYFRPHLQELIDFLHTNQINYCFWSNMLGRNCIKYIKQLESLGMKNYCGIFDQDFCDKPENMPQVGRQGQKVKSIKNLNKLAQMFQIDVNNCILVDDSKQKNVEGCNLIHVNPFEGQQVDKQILYIIERIKQFRKTRVDEQSKVFQMLKYTEYDPRAEVVITAPKIILDKLQKKHQPTEAQIQIQNNPQLKKLKEDLTLQKENRKNIISQIEDLQKSNVQMTQRIKKQSEGKVLKKGDDLLVQVLLFAKNKKASEFKLQELQEKKKTAEQKISIIKKLMRGIMSKLNPNAEQTNQEETKHETLQQNCSDLKKKKHKKKKKLDQTQQDQKIQINSNQIPQAKQVEK